MIRAVIFDVGNTLLYFGGDWNTVTRRGLTDLIASLAATGISLPETFSEDFVRIRHRGRDESARRDVEFTATQALTEALANYGKQNVPSPTLEAALAAFFHAEQENWVTYPDSKQTLEALESRGLLLGAISNATDDAFVRFILAQAGLSQYLEPIVTSAGMPWRKPDPRIFKYVLDQWKLEPSEVVMVGDWPGTDVLGAHRAGMPAVLIDDRWPEAPHLDTEIDDKTLLAPDAVILQLAQLPVLIGQLNASPVVR